MYSLRLSVELVLKTGFTLHCCTNNIGNCFTFENVTQGIIASDIMSNLLTKQASSMEELLDNALSMEQLLVNPSKTNINCPTCTPPNKETLLSVMISSTK